MRFINFFVISALVFALFIISEWLCSCDKDDVIKSKETMGNISIRISILKSVLESQNLLLQRLEKSPHRDIQAEAENISQIVKAVVTISGLGLSNPMVKEFIADQDQKRISGKIDRVPIGSKSILLELKDASNKRLYAASTDIEVAAGQTVTATLKVRIIEKPIVDDTISVDPGKIVAFPFDVKYTDAIGRVVVGGCLLQREGVVMTLSL